jgi:hypothetical protein
MSEEATQLGKVGDWLRLGTAVEANAADLPHLEILGLQLAELGRQVQEVFKEQAALRAGKQDASRRRRELMTEGERLATLMRLAIRQRYGIRSEKLAEFGLQPFRGRKTKRQREALEPAPATPTDPTSG